MAESFDLSGLTVEQLKALELEIYNDLMNRVTRSSYASKDVTFSFSSLSEVKEFLLFIQQEIAKRQSNGGLTLARFADI